MSPIRGTAAATVPAVIKFALKVVLLAAVFYGLTRFDVLSGLDVVPDPEGPLGATGTYLWIGLIFGLVNAIVGPVLRMLSLPFVVLTLGLFLLLINAALLGITAAISDRLDLSGFVPAVLGGLVLAVVGWAADRVLDR